jgi:hypothetical protein
MIRPEFNIGPKTEKSVRGTCVYSVLESAFEQTEQVMARILENRINYKRVLRAGSTDWDVSYSSGRNRRGSSLYLTSDTEQITFRSRIYGPGYERHDALADRPFDRLVGVQRNAGYVSISSVSDYKHRPPRIDELVSVESLHPLTPSAALWVLSKTSAEVLKLAAQELNT